MQPQSHLYQGRTDSCIIVALSKTASLEIKYVFRFNVAPATVYNAIIHCGIPLGVICHWVIEFIPFTLSLVLPFFGPFTLTVRAQNLGKPSLSELEILAEVVNNKEIFIFGHYKLETLRSYQPNDDNNNLYKPPPGSAAAILDAQLDEDGASHTVNIESIIVSPISMTPTEYIGFINDSDDGLSPFYYMNMMVFEGIYCVQITEFWVNRGIRSSVYNAINYPDDKTLISPSFYSHCSSKLCHKFVASLMYHMADYNVDACVGSMISDQSSNDEAMIRFEEFIGKYSILKRNVFIKIGPDVTRTLLLVEMGLLWIANNMKDTASYDSMKEDIFINDAPIRNGNYDDTFSLFIKQKYHRWCIEGIFVKSKEMEISAFCVNHRRLEQIEIVRNIFNAGIWPILNEIGLVNKINDKWALNDFNTISYDDIKAFKTIKYIIPGFDKQINKLIQNAVKLNGIKLKNDGPKQSDDDKLIDIEFGEIEQFSKVHQIPTGINLNLVRNRKCGENMKRYLNNKKRLKLYFTDNYNMNINNDNKNNRNPSMMKSQRKRIKITGKKRKFEQLNWTKNQMLIKETDGLCTKRRKSKPLRNDYSIYIQSTQKYTRFGVLTVICKYGELNCNKNKNKTEKKEMKNYKVMCEKTTFGTFTVYTK